MTQRNFEQKIPKRQKFLNRRAQRLQKFNSNVELRVVDTAVDTSSASGGMLAKIADLLVQ
jgi:hypothetical protein